MKEVSNNVIEFKKNVTRAKRTDKVIRVFFVELGETKNVSRIVFEKSYHQKLIIVNKLI